MFTGAERNFIRVVDDHAPVIEICFYLTSDSFVLSGGIYYITLESTV